MACHEFPGRILRWKIVHENETGFPGAQKLQGETDGVEILGTVDQHGITTLHMLGQDFAGIAR